jgi:hypothetical protein
VGGLRACSSLREQASATQACGREKTSAFHDLQDITSEFPHGNDSRDPASGWLDELGTAERPESGAERLATAAYRMSTGRWARVCPRAITDGIGVRRSFPTRSWSPGRRVL